MDNNSEVVYLYLDDIIPNRFQPREVFDDQALKELAVSIREHGVIQPIIVRKVENKYEIIAGERRYKASTMAGLTKIPAIVKNLDDKESSKIALIENLQRKDLTPIEEARTYQKILEIDDGMTQEQLAATMGKTQSSVSNKLRLLELPEEIQDALLKEKISERHARSLLTLEDKNDQIKMLDRIVAEKLTVRDLDKAIKEVKGEGVEQPAPQTEKTEENKDSSLLTASDIAGATTASKENVDALAGAQAPKIELAVLGSNTSTEAPTEAPTEVPTTVPAAVDPTVVDINKIRENSIDIGGLNQNSSTSTEASEEKKEEEKKEESFKFVPTFSIDEGKEEKTSEPAENKFDKFFNTNTEQDNTNVASAVSTPGLAIPNTTLDVNNAVSDIKETITNLENKGYKVSFEENDDATNYKITINLQK